MTRIGSNSSLLLKTRYSTKVKPGKRKQDEPLQDYEQPETFCGCCEDSILWESNIEYDNWYECHWCGVDLCGDCAMQDEVWPSSGYCRNCYSTLTNRCTACEISMSEANTVETTEQGKRCFECAAYGKTRR